MFEITNGSGQVRQIKITKFSAMDGWELQRKFIEFAASSDKEFRRQYTFEILAYATVVSNGQEIPLRTDALIDNHLEKWENVERVFEEVLLANGINPKTHADRPNYWASAGAEMAIAFIAEASKLMGPALQSID